MSLIKVLFDTNVLAYAHNQASSNHIPSLRLLEMVFQNKIHGIIAEQNIIELYRLLTNEVVMKGKALRPQDAQKLIFDTYLNHRFDLLFPDPQNLEQTLVLVVSNNVSSARIFDIRLASLATRAKVDYLVTYNIKDFLGIASLNCAVPEKILEMLA